MKKSVYYFLFAVFCSIGTSVYAQNNGKVIEGLSMKSQIGNRNINYSIYLPACYDISNRSYPVVYLLHGHGDNETAWVQFGQVHVTADKAIASGEIPAMIIVMPYGGTSFYVNAFDGSNPYEDIMIKEFIPFIDKNYRTRASREFRAVAGLSMGGYGSLILSILHPDVFSFCVALSAAVVTDEEIVNMPEQNHERFIKMIYGDAIEGNRLTPYWQEHSVINLVNTLPAEQLNRVSYYIDNGDDDFLFEGNAMLHIAMRKRGVNHQFRIRDGAHTWSYWRDNIIEGLKFIGEGFYR